ncbi:hypothetical protein Prum_101190 [Phytohabitans rumicis]|uniref:ABC transporter domain-containing protein n=1 Tax=Phytohabitans rumicis TaxID=1076125 RepID=A0A6V8LQT9_9ACTN|nr:ATP-binding cassette domain-containing protein [Phytohabitans rumicis]GFJ96477.1 hypothetical protein Prum_101190 [Phytohabitans rumicis]
MSAPVSAPLLRVQGLVKSFYGNRAVDDVSFDVPAGRVVALLGENGAGKSTVIKMLAGVYGRDAGHIFLDGQEITKPDGISFIHQDLGLVEWMTVAENIALATGFPGGRRRLVSWRAVRRQAEQTLALIGGGIDPDTRIFDLPRTERSLLAIARALVGGAKLLVLDEPTASLPAADVERLFAVLRRLREDGVGMIYVSHRLDEIFQIADDVVVMRNGRVVGAAPTARFTPAELVRLIVGRETRPGAPGAVGSGSGWSSTGSGSATSARWIFGYAPARWSGWSACAAPGRRRSAARWPACSRPGAAPCGWTGPRSRPGTARWRYAPGSGSPPPTASPTASRPACRCARTSF